MKFVFIISSPPFGDPLLKIALEYAKASVSAGHETSIFLYGDGVYNSLNGINPAYDEFNPATILKKLSEKSGIYYCETAAMRRGVNGSNVSDYAKCSTLGELSHLISSADRVIYL